MDAKDVYVVVEFVIAATELKGRDARAYIDEIPQEQRSNLYLLARKWKRESQQAALEALMPIVNRPSALMNKAVQRAQIPSHKQEPDDRPDSKRKQKRS